MAINAKQRQKKLEKKTKKRKLAKKLSGSGGQSAGLKLSTKAINYAKFPIHECLVPSNLFELGIGNVIIARRTSEGDIALCALVVDVFCLGVKNSLFHVVSEYEYEHKYKPGFLSTEDEGVSYEKVHLTCARKLVEGAIQYAQQLGFVPHRDYRKDQAIFANLEASACPVKYIYGNHGKPDYIRGPNESVAQAKQIVAQLHKKCGEGNFNYTVMFDDGMFE